MRDSLDVYNSGHVKSRQPSWGKPDARGSPRNSPPPTALAAPRAWGDSELNCLWVHQAGDDLISEWTRTCPYTYGGQYTRNKIHLKLPHFNRDRHIGAGF